MNPRVIAIARKEVLQLFRDHKSLVMIFLLPVIQLVLFGYVVANDVENIKFAVFDQDRSGLSRQLVTKIEKSGFFVNQSPIDNYRVLEEMLNSGAIKIGLVIPKGFNRDLLAAKQPSLQVIIDGTDSNTASIARNYLINIINSFAEQIRDERLLKMGQSKAVKTPLDFKHRVYYNPELRSINYMIPGITALVLLIITTLLTALSVVKEKELGTNEQLMVTPIKPWEIILGKLAPFPVIGLFDLMLMMIMGSLWFRVPIKGNLFLLGASSSSFIMASLGIGLLISTISQTQQQAMLSAMFFLIPNILLSGFIFPIANMPVILQTLTYAIPARYFLEIVRGIYLKGTGCADLFPQIAALAFFSVVILAYSVRSFRKQLG